MRSRVQFLVVRSQVAGLRLRESMRKDDGLTTAEYAVGTVAAAGLGGVLLKLLTSDEVKNLIWSLVRNAFASLMG